jgi:hypothetical protein
MKPKFISLFVSLLAMTLFTGCVISLGGGKTCPPCRPEHTVAGPQTAAPTLGQQLMDLQKAKETGAITDTEYQEQKAKLLESK